MSWGYLFLAGLAEVGFILEIKLSEGFQKIGHSLASLIIMIMSVVFLSLAIRKIPIATAYALWTGIGVIGTVLLECLFFEGTFSFLRIICIGFILIGIIGLKLL